MGIGDVLKALDKLDEQTASSLEGQRLDFKRWNSRSARDSVDVILRAAVCMANGGGGCVVVGVDDRARGRQAAICGVPDDVDEVKIIETIAARTAPSLRVEIQAVGVSLGTGKVLVVMVPDCYTTTTDGQSWKRIGDSCIPMTPDVVVNHLEARGDLDLTARIVPVGLDEIISPAAIDRLRGIASHEAPKDLLSQSDERLMDSLGVLREGRPTLAAVLLAGTAEAIERYLPAYKWTFLRMHSMTDYSDRADGQDALPIALERINDRIMADNPIDTIEYGLLHLEYRKFPELAVREALLNAFGHADYRVASPITIEQFADRLVIANPGTFVGGITPSNILRHASVARNPCLMEALLRLRLVNRTHLGVRRMYQAMLVDGKEPPIWDGSGHGVRVVMLGRRMSPAFRAFVDDENRRGRPLDIEDMLILQHLSGHGEITTSTARTLTQETAEEARSRLNRLAMERGYLARGGTGRGTYWRLRRPVHERIAGAGLPDRDNRIDWSTARSEVVAALRQRARRNETGLTNSEIRQITSYDRSQVKRLMGELRAEGSVVLRGRGAGATYYHSSHSIIEQEN